MKSKSCASSRACPIGVVRRWVVTTQQRSFQSSVPRILHCRPFRQGFPGSLFKRRGNDGSRRSGSSDGRVLGFFPFAFAKAPPSSHLRSSPGSPTIPSCGNDAGSNSRAVRPVCALLRRRRWLGFEPDGMGHRIGRRGRRAPVLGGAPEQTRVSRTESPLLWAIQALPSSLGRQSRLGRASGSTAALGPKLPRSLAMTFRRFAVSRPIGRARAFIGAPAAMGPAQAGWTGNSRLGDFRIGWAAIAQGSRVARWNFCFDNTQDIQDKILRETILSLASALLNDR
jgi:hypothetical protein